MESLGLDPAFWEGRRVLVTGHTGFKGSWMTLWLRSLGAEVAGYSLPPSTNPNLFEAARVADGIHSVIGDIRDYGAFSRAVQESGAEIVLHLAAQPLVRESYVDPIGTYETNVMGTVHLLNAVRELKTCRSMLIVTTDKCYENKEWDYPYREIDPLGGYDPYSSSKACAEVATQAFRRSFFSAGVNVCVGSGRAGNVIGGGDWAKDRLVTDSIAALTAGKDVLIRNPHAVRPWQHVLEPVYGYLRWAQLSFAQPELLASEWNFGPSPASAKPVSAMVDRICKLWGPDAIWRSDDQSHPHEAGLLRLDSSKAERYLQWQGSLDFDRTMQWTVEWFRAFLKGQSARDLTLAQIVKYQKIVTGAA